MQTERSSLKFWHLMPTKRLVRDYNELLPGCGYVTDPDKPAPRNRQQRGEALHCFREEEEKTKGAHNNLSYESRFCLLTILMDSQVSKSLKQRFLILLLVSPAAASLSLSLSLSSHSDRQISSNKLFQLYTYFHTAMRSIINGHACGCCAVLKL